MIRPNDGGDPREIDFLIEFDIPLHGKMRIAIEAKDHKRPLDVQIVEQYVGKYHTGSGLLVNKVIIVGNSFSKTAIKKAAKVGFSLQTLKSLNLDLPAYFDSGEPKTPSIKKENIENGIGITLFDSNLLLLPSDLQIFDHSGKSFGTAEHLGKRIWIGKPYEMFSKHIGENRGQMFQPVFQIELSNHFAVLRGKSIKLKGIVVNPPSTLVIPKMNAKHFDMTDELGNTKRFVTESGVGQENKMSITYEAGVGAPAGGIQIDIKDKSGTPPKATIWLLTWNL